MDMFGILYYGFTISSNNIPKVDIKRLRVNKPSNNSSYYSGEFDMLNITTVNNSHKQEEEKMITKNYDSVEYRVDQNVDLGILDLKLLSSKEKGKITTVDSKMSHSLNSSRMYTYLSNRYDNRDILNPGKVGALSVGTLIDNSPVNKKEAPVLSNLGVNTNMEETDLLHYPVSKREKERQSILKTSDSCKFIFAPSIVNDTGADDFDFKGSGPLNIPYIGPDAEHISGAQYWYKDYDNIPSVIRPINFSNYVSLFSDFSLDTSLRYVQGANNSYWDYSKSCDFKDDAINVDRLIKKTNVFNRLAKAFRNKIVVTEFKRVNTTLNRENVIDKCPILESYLASGYRVVNNDNLKTIMEDFYTYAVTTDFGNDTSKSLRRDVINSLFVQARGKRFDFEKTVLDFKEIIRNDGKVKFEPYQPKYGDPGYSCGHIFYAMPSYTPNIVSGLYDPNVHDYEDFGRYSVGNYEVKRIIRDSNLGIIIANSIYNKSVCLVKHTIIELNDESFAESDYFYDIETNLLIGKIFKDRDRTLRNLNSGHHPSCFNLQKQEPEVVRYRYVVHGSSRLPAKVYINVNGGCLELKSEINPSMEEGVYVSIGNKISNYINPKRFSYDGVFETRAECESYTRFGDYYKDSINNGLLEYGRENELLRREVENVRYKNDLDKLRIESILLGKEESVTHLKADLLEQKYRQELELLAKKGELSKQEFIQKLIELERKKSIHSLNVAEDIIDATIRFANMFDKIVKQI